MAKGKADFSQYLKVKVEDIEAPEAPPIGHYYATIKSWKTDERQYQKDEAPEPVISIFFTITEPDEDALEESEAAATKAKGKLVSKDYSLSDGSGQDALRKLGEKTLELPVKGLDLEDLLNELPGQEVKLYMEQRAGKGEREGQFFPKVSKVLSAQD
jgi:hypothetical protein